MRCRLPTGVLFTRIVCCCLGLAGCARAPVEGPKTPTKVVVSYPIEREVTAYAGFTARLAAVDCVEVRAHVWGYLQKVNFKEGSLVKKGDVLFEIDPRPYQAILDQARAKVRQDEAQLTSDEAEYRCAEQLIGANAISQSDFDKTAAARNVDLANIAADKALVASRELDLQYTKIAAPISGRVSRYLVTVGNLIQSAEQANVTLLTTIVSVDPIYAYFDVDEATIQHLRQCIRKASGESGLDQGLPITLGLTTEQGFPHQGTVNFVDNQVNPKTGTLRVRGVFPNRGESLTTGFFARVRVPLGPPRHALLVSDRALDSDQGQKILYVVNGKNEIVSRPVRTGLSQDGLRVIEDGLKGGERVVVNGLQLVQPGVTVEPMLVEMPNAGYKNHVSGERPSRADRNQGGRNATMNNRVMQPSG